MTYATGALLIVVAIQTAVIVAGQIERTRRTRAELSLRASEERFRRIANRTPAMIWTARANTTLDYLNDACAEYTGLPIEKLQNEGWLDAVHPDDLERCIGIYAPAIEARRPFLVEYRMRRADGAYRWLLATGVPNHEPDGSFSGYSGCDVDITERKEGEDQVRASQAALEASHREIQHLAGRLIEAQDAERARIARDLHDDVSQQLAGLSIALSGLKIRMDEFHVSEELQADMRAHQQRATALAQSVRQLSHDLHPAVLRHAGLLAALTSYCAELKRSRNVDMTCSGEGDLGPLAPEVALPLYRIAQEALRNVVAHAGAHRADVRLLRMGDEVEITIVDDGKGFDVARMFERNAGLGLLSMRERARLAGGTLSVMAHSNQGTCVRARVPAYAPPKGDIGSRTEGERRELHVS